MDSQLTYNIGITLLPGVGDITAKNLIAYCGSAENVFKTKKSHFEKIPGIGNATAASLTNDKIIKEALARAEKEIKFIEKEKINPVFFTDKYYPSRLKQCEDSPIMLYTKGGMNLNTEHMISIVGSRKATEYGKKICEQLLTVFAPYNALIISGLAYGIDICAHRASLKNNLATIGVLAHGLDNLYPAEHRYTANKMLEKGGLLTEFMSQTKMNPEYFPRRNRIVAGMAVATIVIEATLKSGALITAEIANSYNRDVFAIPGRLDDSSSEGCNFLIKSNKAALIQSAEDVIRLLNWDLQSNKPKQVQKELFDRLSVEEEILVSVMKEKNNVHIDELSIVCRFPMSKTASLLLNLEFSGVIKSLPGKRYALNN